jgi:predicted GIY-YIG superfamily endonuclease
MKRHASGAGSKYVRANGFEALLAYTGPFRLGHAMRLEAKIKRMTRKRKLALVDLWRESAASGF